MSSFVSSRSSDAAFDICLQSLRLTLEQTEGTVDKFLACTSEASRTELLLQIGRLDILVRQKSDQVHFLFVSQPTQVPVEKLTKDEVRGFWTESFGAEVRMVPWSEFQGPFLEAAGEEGLGEEDVATVSQFVDFTLDGWVSIYELEVFMLSFGPLRGCAQRMLAPYKAGILAGYTSSAEANTLLHGQAPGSYLVRFSKSNAGSFAVTFVDSKSRIKHCLLYAAQPSGITLREPPDVFETLEQFVRAHAKRLKMGLGARAHRSRPVSVSGAMAARGASNPYTRSLSGGNMDAYSLDAMDADEEEQEEKSMCVVCMANRVGTCFIPCGHVCCCKDCGAKLQQLKEKRCPVCRNAISSVQTIFMV